MWHIVVCVGVGGYRREVHTLDVKSVNYWGMPLDWRECQLHHAKAVVIA